MEWLWRELNYLAWLICYRWLNTIFERSKDLIAFVAIAFISILARRRKPLVAEDLGA